MFVASWEMLIRTGCVLIASRVFCRISLLVLYSPDKIVKNNAKYPAERAKGKSEKYTAYEAAAASATASVPGMDIDTAANRGSRDGDSASVKK